MVPVTEKVTVWSREMLMSLWYVGGLSTFSGTTHPGLRTSTGVTGVDHVHGTHCGAATE